MLKVSINKEIHSFDHFKEMMEFIEHEAAYFNNFDPYIALEIIIIKDDEPGTIQIQVKDDVDYKERLG